MEMVAAKQDEMSLPWRQTDGSLPAVLQEKQFLLRCRRFLGRVPHKSSLESFHHRKLLLSMVTGQSLPWNIWALAESRTEIVQRELRLDDMIEHYVHLDVGVDASPENKTIVHVCIYPFWLKALESSGPADLVQQVALPGAMTSDASVDTCLPTEGWYARSGSSTRKGSSVIRTHRARLKQVTSRSRPS